MPCSPVEVSGLATLVAEGVRVEAAVPPAASVTMWGTGVAVPVKAGTGVSLFEAARSAGMGLVLAAQSTPGLSNDESRRRRALSSGAALLIGRSKDPEDTVKYTGTTMRMEASGAATGENLNSARAQHTYVLPPQVVREAADGAFWLVQAGGIASFRAMPPAPAGEHDPTAVPEEVDRIETPGDVDAVPVDVDAVTDHSPAIASDESVDTPVPAPEPATPKRPRFQPQNGFGAARTASAVKLTQEPQAALNDARQRIRRSVPCSHEGRRLAGDPSWRTATTWPEHGRQPGRRSHGRRRRGRLAQRPCGCRPRARRPGGVPVPA